MAARIALLCLLGMLVAASAANSGIYYQIGFMWPGAYCEQTNAGCCKPTTGVSPASDFYISSFRAYNATTYDPNTQCKTAPFNLNQIINMTGLKQYWSNIRCPSNNGESFWRKAWKKSGVCSGLNETAYFETALSFRGKINPLVRLKAAGIVPDFSLYSPEVIKRVFEEASKIRAAPVIQCSKGPFNKFQLYQLYFCASGNATAPKFIDCPNAPAYTCDKEILFHPFKKWMLKQKVKEDVEESETAEAAYYDDEDPLELPGLAMDS